MLLETKFIHKDFFMIFKETISNLEEYQKLLIKINSKLNTIAFKSCKDLVTTCNLKLVVLVSVLIRVIFSISIKTRDLK